MLAVMLHKVTVILVVRNGGDVLSRTVAALRAQDRQPEALYFVTDDARTLADIDTGAAKVVLIPPWVSFGAAVRSAERVLDAPTSDADSLWLLTEDSAPQPSALAMLLGSLETSKSVVISAPKLVQWDQPDRIALFGRSMTRLGPAGPLVADELDQGQDDDVSEVLGVNPAGMLIRQTVWRELDGFDPALPIVDDGLDLAIRARLAGYRVEMVPLARVEFAQNGVGGPPSEGPGPVGASGRTTGQNRAALSATRLRTGHPRAVFLAEFVAARADPGFWPHCAKNARSHRWRNPSHARGDVPFWCARALAPTARRTPSDELVGAVIASYSTARGAGDASERSAGPACPGTTVRRPGGGSRHGGRLGSARFGRRHGCALRLAAGCVRAHRSRSATTVRLRFHPLAQRCIRMARRRCGFCWPRRPLRGSARGAGFTDVLGTELLACRALAVCHPGCRAGGVVCGISLHRSRHPARHRGGAVGSLPIAAHRSR